jgi:DNA-binding NtrC family response regulator
MGKRGVAFTADLMFSSNIEATLARSDCQVASIEDLPSLERELNRGDVDLVILDLHAGVEAGAVVMLCMPYGIPVLAFGRHTEPALLRSARESGCAEVVPRSTFVEQMPQLVERIMSAGQT